MISDEQYTQHVLGRASTHWHGEKMDIDDLKIIMSMFINCGRALDAAKKSLMYGRDFEPEFLHLTGEANGVAAYMTPLPDVDVPCPPIPECEQGIMHAILGAATEGVELIEAAYKYLFEGAQFDKVNLQEEFGDIQWYRALGLFHLDQTHEQNITQNDAKLEKRFGPVSEGFTYKAVNERDLEGERQVLEGKEE